MSFNLEKLFIDVFSPVAGEVVSIMYDIPYGKIVDNKEWGDRRRMAEEWHQKISMFSQKHKIILNPMISYLSTGSPNSDLPQQVLMAGEKYKLEDILKKSTIFISMPEFSASAPMITFTKEISNLRGISMPGVTKAMEKTGLSADYKKIAKKCSLLKPLFDTANRIEVEFSTGHTCVFDISSDIMAIEDNGLLPPGKKGMRLNNMPAGEVYICPNEAIDSQTEGEIPMIIENEQPVFIVKNNQIVDVQGNGIIAKERRQAFKNEPALRNIAEVAIGCNDKAVVTGNILEDEKAGFHWAYGRSDHLGGQIGISNFSSPEKVYHLDIVYAKGNPIVCRKFDFVFSDGSKKTAIIDGKLIL